MTLLNLSWLKALFLVLITFFVLLAATEWFWKVAHPELFLQKYRIMMEKSLSELGSGCGSELSFIGESGQDAGGLIESDYAIGENDSGESRKYAKSSLAIDQQKQYWQLLTEC